MEFEFTIRKDAVWPNVPPLFGRAVTSADIAFSLNRVMDDRQPNSDLLSNFEEIRAPDEGTLVVRLRTPDAEMFETLANGRLVVVAQESVELTGDLVNGPTLGSGAWKLEESLQAGASFSANRLYYDRSAPVVDGLDVQYIQSASTRATGVRVKLLDFVETSFNEMRSAVESFPELQSMSATVPGTGVELALNTSRGPLQSLEYREAMFLAWDLVSETVRIWDGDPSPSVGLNVPDAGWEKDFDSEFGTMFGDADRANEILTDLGIFATERLTIVVGEFGATSEDDPYILVAESISDALGNLGVPVDVTPVQTRFFAENVWIDGDYDIFVGAPPPIESLNGQLFGVYHSEGPWNTTGFNSQELDSLIEQQAVELDRARRGMLLREIQAEIMQQRQRFFPVVAEQHWLWQPGVKGFYPDTSGASGDFLSKMWIQAQE